MGGILISKALKCVGLRCSPRPPNCDGKPPTITNSWLRHWIELLDNGLPLKLSPPTTSPLDSINRSRLFSSAWHQQGAPISMELIGALYKFKLMAVLIQLLNTMNSRLYFVASSEIFTSAVRSDGQTKILTPPYSINKTQDE